MFLSKYKTVPKYKELSEKWPVSKLYTTAKEDPVFGYLKFSSKCNYKPGLFDSLSIFEHPFSFQVYKGLHYITSELNQKTGCDVKNLKQAFDLLSFKLLHNS